MKDYELLKQFILESVKEKPFQLEDGRILEYGSKNHIKELDSMITNLDFLRKQMKSKSLRKERYTISRAIDSIRQMKRSARRSGIKNGLLNEDD